MAGHLAVADDPFSRHHDVRDSERRRLGVLDGRLVDHDGGVEHDQVGDVTGRDPAAILEPQLCCGEAGHLVNCCLQRQHLLLAHVTAEHAGESAGAARMRAVQFAVAAEHDVGMRDEPAQVVLAHRRDQHVLHRFVAADLGLRGLDDAHVGFDRRHLPGRSDLFERLARERRLGRVLAEANGRGATVVGDRAGHLFRIEIVAIRHDDADRRVPERVRIHVGLQVDVLAAGLLEIRRHPRRRLVPDRRRTELDVRDLDRNARFAADAQDFVERFESPVGLVADVADVEAARRRRHLRQFDHFFRGRKVRRFVFEARRQAEGTRRQFLREQRLHLREFLRRRRAVQVLAHGLLAQRRVADHARHVDRRRRGLELPEPVPQRKVGLAILTNDNRGHALATHRGGIEILEQPAVAVAMHVDEARCEGQAVLVTHGLAGKRLKVRCDRRNPVALDADIRSEWRSARTVIDGDVTDQYVGVCVDAG